MEKKVDPVYFEKFVLNYTELPEEYPMLPIKALGHQPSVYAQGNSTHLYGTILVPLSVGQVLLQPEYAEMKSSGKDGDVYTYQCSFDVVEDGSITTARLALVKFEVDLPQDLVDNTLIKVSVNITDPVLGDNVGKVIMDATMLPSEP